MGNAALVNADNIVENRIVYDLEAGFKSPEGKTLIVETPDTGTAWVGLGWDGTVFEQPAPGVDPMEDPNFVAPLDQTRRLDNIEKQMTEILTLLKK